MLGPYYRFQITSLLSITSRITGIWLAVVTAPLAIIWLLALAAGAQSFVYVQAFLGSLPGQLLALVSLFSLWYHLLNGIRHLVWDTGRGFEKSQIWASGYLVIAATVVLGALSFWVAL